jgi:hypothetical protein
MELVRLVDNTPEADGLLDNLVVQEELRLANVWIIHTINASTTVGLCPGKLNHFVWILLLRWGRLSGMYMDTVVT